MTANGKRKTSPKKRRTSKDTAKETLELLETEKQSNRSVRDWFTTIATVAREANAGTMLVGNHRIKNLDGATFYVIYRGPDATAEDVIETLSESLQGDDA